MAHEFKATAQNNSTVDQSEVILRELDGPQTIVLRTQEAAQAFETGAVYTVKITKDVAETAKAVEAMQADAVICEPAPKKGK